MSLRIINNPPPSIELADSLTATLVKRFPKKWAAQIKRACEDSFAEFLDGRDTAMTYSIRSGRLLYLAIPKWTDAAGNLSLEVEVIYLRARVSGAIVNNLSAVSASPVEAQPSIMMELPPVAMEQ